MTLFASQCQAAVLTLVRASPVASSPVQANPVCSKDGTETTSTRYFFGMDITHPQDSIDEAGRSKTKQKHLPSPLSHACTDEKQINKTPDLNLATKTRHPRLDSISAVASSTT